VYLSVGSFTASTCSALQFLGNVQLLSCTVRNLFGVSASCLAAGRTSVITYSDFPVGWVYQGHTAEERILGEPKLVRDFVVTN
jgi:hypothetical protein